MRAYLRLALCGLLLLSSHLYAGGFLYKITGKPGIVWLYGTIHVGKADFYPLSAVVDKALQASDGLTLEINLADPAQMQAVAAAMKPINTPLSARISPAFYQTLKTGLAQHYGLDIAQFDHAALWQIFTVLDGTLADKQGYSPLFGTDVYLLTHAKKPISGLETAKDQIQIFLDMDPVMLEKILTEMVSDKGAADAEKELRTLLQAWQKGDAKAIQKIYADDQKDPSWSSAFEEQLVLARNRGFVIQLDAMLRQPGEHFVAIGALHLVGPKNVPDGLQQLGWAVERVPLD